jgi:very-short-patch-repair endonuclease
MNLLIVLSLFAVLVMVIIAAVTNKESRRAALQIKERDQAPIKARSLLTTNEQMTFLKLRKALPNCVVLTRVAMSALLNSNGLVTRNKINRCCVDFVVLDRDFKIISIVEISQLQQNKNIPKISERDTMLMEAGYRVIRYTHAPDIERITADFSEFLQSEKAKQLPLSKLAFQNNHLLDEDNFFEHNF